MIKKRLASYITYQVDSNCLLLTLLGKLQKEQVNNKYNKSIFINKFFRGIKRN